MARAGFQQILFRTIDIRSSEMTDISIQFHATPDELLSLVRDCVTEFDLHVVAMKFFPFEAVEVSGSHLDEVFSSSSAFRELALTLQKPFVAVRSSTEFFDKNPNKLRLDIERPSEKGLKQTWLTARVNDTEALPIWQEVARRVKAISKVGVVVVNPHTGASVRSRSFRYTEGAKALESMGIQMLAGSGGCLIRLGADERRTGDILLST